VEIIELSDAGEPIAARRVEFLTDTAFEILRQAAQDIPNLEEIYIKSRIKS
jgi:hypothetical protein